MLCTLCPWLRAAAAASDGGTRRMLCQHSRCRTLAGTITPDLCAVLLVAMVSSTVPNAAGKYLARQTCCARRLHHSLLVTSAFNLHCPAAGKYLARQTCVLRGVVPMLAAPMSEGSGGALKAVI